MLRKVLGQRLIGFKPGGDREYQLWFEDGTVVVFKVDSDYDYSWLSVYIADNDHKDWVMLDDTKEVKDE